MFHASRGSQGRNTHWDRRLALLLATIAGFVDAVGYLTLQQVFVAHMTGNTSKLGIALGRGSLHQALPLAAVPMLFVTGIAAGTVIVDAGRRWAALLLQAVLIAGFAAYAPSVVRDGGVPGHSLSGFYVLAALATLALGLQTAALTQIHGATVRTSYISGVLTNLAQATARRLSGRPRDRIPAALLTAVCVCYLAGAVAGAAGLDRFGTRWLVLPAAALVCAGGGDLRRSRSRCRPAAGTRHALDC